MQSHDVHDGSLIKLHVFSSGCNKKSCRTALNALAWVAWLQNAMKDFARLKGSLVRTRTLEKVVQLLSVWMEEVAAKLVESRAGEESLWGKDELCIQVVAF